MRNAIVVAVAIASLAIPNAARAASVEAYVSIDDVRACAPADDGAIWIATTGGVARVRDGKVERVFTKLDGLLDGKANALSLDGADLWIGTEKGLIRAKIAANAFSVASSSASPSVRAIARSGGTTYVATFGGGVEKLGDDGKLVSLPFAEAKGASARVRGTSLVDFGGTIVAGTAGAGLYRLIDGKLAAMPVGGAKSISALGVHDGRLFVGALEGTFSVADAAVREESSSDVRAFAESGASLFAASFSDGVLVETKAGFFAAPNAPSTKWTQTIGARGDLRCVGTPTGAFVKTEGAQWKPVATSGPPSNDVTAIARIDDRIYVGTYDRGVASLGAGAWSMVQGLADDARVDAMLADGKRLWIGTTRGLVRIDGATATTFDASLGLPSNEVHALASLGKGAVFVGTAKGAAIVDGAKVISLGKKQGLAIDAAWAVAKLADGTLLVGASTGLYARKAGETKWIRFSVTSGDLLDDWVTALVVHGTDVFVGTYAGGVAQLSFGASSVKSASLGGGSINVGGLTLVGNKLYASTMDGLLARPLDGSAWKDETHLALGVDVTATLAAPDGLWIASRRGLTHVKS